MGVAGHGGVTHGSDRNERGTYQRLCATLLRNIRPWIAFLIPGAPASDAAAVRGNPWLVRPDGSDAHPESPDARFILLGPERDGPCNIRGYDRHPRLVELATLESTVLPTCFERFPASWQGTP